MNQNQIWQAGKPVLCSPGAVIPLLEEAMLAALPRGHALAGFSPNVGQEAPRIVSTLNLVAAGLGVSLVPASLQRMHMDTWCIAACAICAMQRSRGHLLLATRRWDGSAVVQRFVELVRRMAQEFATDGARAAG
jgi:DNA-binding transcriptional LysR family regulator